MTSPPQQSSSPPPAAPSPAAPAAAAADTVHSAQEYIPPHPAPHLPTSESMRRLAALIISGKLSVSDRLTFSYNGTAFHATLTASGALSSPAPRPSSAHPNRLSENVCKLYESPKDFASEMALVAVNADPKKTKPRGRLSINGWEQCMLGDRSLDSLRHEMLREKKPSLSPAEKAPLSHPLKSNLKTADKSKVDKSESSPTPSDAVNTTEEVKPADQIKKADTDSKQSKLDGDRPASNTDEGKDNNTDKDAETSAPKSPQSPKTETQSKMEPSARASVDSERDGSSAAKPNLSPSGNVEDKEVVSPAKQSPLKPSTPEKEADAKEDAAPAQEAAVDAEMPDVEQGANPEGGSDKKDAPATSAEEAITEAKPRDKATDSKAADKEAPDAKAAQHKSEDTEMHEEGDAENIIPKGGEPGVDQEKETVPGPDLDDEQPSEAQGVEKAKSEKSMQGSEKPSSPAVKQGNKKRKRTDSKDSTPSGEVTPSRRSQEGGASQKADWGRKARKLDIPSASEMASEGLDPEAIEAAAIAAQADKEEANRARRTTRLASGKIKQVDYKASANAQGSRSMSPGREFDEVDISPNDSGAEPVRASRRRATQTHAVVPQRSSRRVARKRSSQERDQSSNEDLDHSSPGNASDVFVEGDNGMEIDSGAGTRVNGSRTEGRDRKRARSDGGAARRTRQNHTEVADFDVDERAHYGTRSSTRENSVGDGGDVIDGEATVVNIDKEEEEEEDPEKRKDRYGWTVEDLTRIGDAVDLSNSTEQQNISVELYQAGNWTTDEAANKNVARYVEDANRSIVAFKKEVLGDDAPDEVTGTELRAFIATDIWRLKTGGVETEVPRKPEALDALAEGEEQIKSFLERTRRKLQREVEDLRRDLDTELEARRKADLDAAYLEIQLTAASQSLPREEARRMRLETEIERYRTKEDQTRRQLDRTKILMNQLRGETDSPEDLGSMAKNNGTRSRQVKEEDCGNEEVEKGERVVGESVTSEDDVGMKAKEEASRSERQLEMERLRVLIAVREAESEAKQRACEVESIKYANLMDSKTRLESELYSHRTTGALGGGGGVSGSPVMSSTKVGKESSRKGDHRNGGSGGQRGPSGSRGRNTKGSGNGAGGGSHKAGGGSKGKNGGGKNGDAAKSSKKKGSTRVQNGAGADK